METLRRRLDPVDRRIVTWLQEHSIRILRIALAIVFIWFGALKVFDVSPVRGLVAAAVPWFSHSWFFPLLGVCELAIGLGLLFRVALRAVLLLTLLQLTGTFLTLITQPEVTFGSHPLLLTLEGEFVIKNLVLLSAALVVGSTVRAQDDTCVSPEEEA